MAAVGKPLLPNLLFGHFEDDRLGAPGSSKIEDVFHAALWHPLPAVVDRFITSDPERGIVRSWKNFGPPKDDLAYVQVTHMNMEGHPQTGEFVVHRDLAKDVMSISEAIFNAAFPIEGARLIDYWDADDDRSMAANNSSALCVRQITGGGNLSHHALGRALDINTLLNPYHNPAKGIIAPIEGAEFLDRSRHVPGMIHEGDAVVNAFDAHGWEWGGRWTDRIDYQHFQKPLKA